MKQTLLFIFLCAMHVSCNTGSLPTKNKGKDTVALITKPAITIICDSSLADTPVVKSYRKMLQYDLQPASLNGFLDRYQSNWRQGIAWILKRNTIDSNTMLQCLCATKGKVFIYIPNHYVIQDKYVDNIKFYLVNNSDDTLRLHCIDATLDRINSTVAPISNDTGVKWLSLQKTTHKGVDCGNSYWKMALPPKSFLECKMDSEYLGMGDTLVNYRLELETNSQVITSNPIPIHLLKEQLKYVGKPFDEI